MIKHFCDCCKVELTDSNKCQGASPNPYRLGSTYSRSLTAPKLMFEVITGKDGTWNNGDFCKYCVIDAVSSLDDRPRCA